jgi:hypothetical protein
MGDAEAVLFVDHDEREPPEADRRLHQRVRSDEYIHLSRLERPENRAPRRAANPSGQQSQSHTGSGEETD